MAIVKISKKTSKYLMIALISVLTFSIYSGFNKFEEKSTYTNTNNYVHFAIVLNDLIHELQKERGYSSGFVASNGKSFSLELKKQRRNTYKKIKLLKTLPLLKIVTVEQANDC